MPSPDLRVIIRARASVSRMTLCVAITSLSLSAQGNAATQAPDDDPNRDIIVYGQPLFRDIQPERSLDEDAIESYGTSTIDELLGEVQVELGEDAELPLIIVNGQRINDLSEIGAFPVEVLDKVQILPRGSAVALGGRTGQRVINLTLKRQTRSATASAGHKIATDGEWSSSRGEGILTRIKGNTRANLTLRARSDAALFESERGIIQPVPRLPYALGGNVVGYPDSSGEIDPSLSALAGRTVTVVPIPGSSNPTLADFAARANQAAVTDLGDFRTLRPDSRNYDLNATLAAPLTGWLSANATFRLNRNTSLSKRGLPTKLLVISPDNDFSPFSRDVALALYGPAALRSRSRREGGEGNVTLNGQFGRWTANWNSVHRRAHSVTATERPTSSSTLRLDDDVNPFTTNVSSLITIGSNRYSSRNVDTISQLTVNGPVTTLPAGPLVATLEGRLEWNRVTSISRFGGGDDPRRFRRAEQAIRGAVDVPLTSRDFLSAAGDLDLNLEYGKTHYSDAGNANRYAYALSWEPRPILRLTGSIESTENPAPAELLGGPVTVLQDVRTYDPLTGQTVDVTQITGSNPNLLPQKTKVRRLNAILRLVPTWNLQLTGEYTDTDRRNFVSSLPEASAAVTLAFPDRFIRNSSGVLTSVDLRPVNFESERDKRLRWGISMNRKLGSSSPVAAAPRAAGTKRPPPAPRTYLQLTANHTIVFSDQIVIRPGLDPVDLLGGGAIGIASGRTRHQVDGTASLTSGGTGARIGINWRGKSRLESRIGGVEDTLRFSPVMLINIRAFTELKRFFPRSDWAKGLRLSVDVLNLSNDRQEVYDSFGHVPLQYQPGYRDPIGRTVEFEIRKVF